MTCFLDDIRSQMIESGLTEQDVKVLTSHPAIYDYWLSLSTTLEMSIYSDIKFLVKSIEEGKNPEIPKHLLPYIVHNPLVVEAMKAKIS